MLITVGLQLRDSRSESVFVPEWLVFRVLFVLVIFINSNGNINRHVLLFFYLN